MKMFQVKIQTPWGSNVSRKQEATEKNKEKVMEEIDNVLTLPDCDALKLKKEDGVLIVPKEVLKQSFIIIKEFSA